MTRKFTPGTWEIEVGGEDYGVYRLSTMNAATIYERGGVDACDAEQDANIALITDAPEMHEILYKFAAGAVVRGRCVWCAHAGDPDDGKHGDTCIVPRAAALVARHGEPVGA